MFKPVKKTEVSDEAKVLTTTWIMKKISNGYYHARLNTCGFEQEKDEHNDESSISFSVTTNDSTTRLMLTLLLMAIFGLYIVDVKGAFVHGEFDNGEVIKGSTRF